MATKKNTESAKEKPLAARKPRQMAFTFPDSPSASSFVRTAYKARKSVDESWRGMMAVPPGSLLEIILNEFKSNTNIPLEIPFITFLHYVGGYLLSKNIQIEVQGQLLQADFWTIVLAESGAGKTWTSSQISKALNGAVPEFNGNSSSAAAFIESLEKTPRGLFTRDEFLQFIKQLEQSGGNMSEVKDYMLRIYDNSTIERNTKQYSAKIENPALSVLAFNVTDTFCDHMSFESLTDGFAQRFSYVLAEKDPARCFVDYAIWSIETGSWRHYWDQLTANLHPVYKISPDAEKHFLFLFKQLSNATLDESFYRRIMWRAHKYALIYHIMRGNGANEIVDKEAYAWASRLITLQLADTAKVLDKCTGDQLSKLVERCEKAIVKMNNDKLPITPRTLLQRVKGLGNAANARFVFELLGLKE